MEYNGNTVIPYYPLPNIMDLLARLQNYTIFSSLNHRLGYHHISLKPEAKLKTNFATKGGKWECGSFWCMLTSRCLLLSYVAGIVRFGFYFTYLDDILVYTASREEHLQHHKVVFQCLKEANLKTKLSKCHFFKKAPSLFRSFYLQKEYPTITRNSSNCKKSYRNPLIWISFIIS